VAGGRRQRHRRGKREQNEREAGFQPDERGEASHHGTPDGVARTGQRREKVPAVRGSEDEDRDEDGELGEEQAAVRRPRQAEGAR
jgi:hypothetical protein